MTKKNIVSLVLWMGLIRFDPMQYQTTNQLLFSKYFFFLSFFLHPSNQRYTQPKFNGTRVIYFPMYQCQSRKKNVVSYMISNCIAHGHSSQQAIIHLHFFRFGRKILTMRIDTKNTRTNKRPTKQFSNHLELLLYNEEEKKIIEKEDFIPFK